MKFGAAIILLCIGAVGAFWHFQASMAKGRFVGTSREVKFVMGTLMVLSCIPAGLVTLGL